MAIKKVILRVKTDAYRIFELPPALAGGGKGLSIQNKKNLLLSQQVFLL